MKCTECRLWRYDGHMIGDHPLSPPRGFCGITLPPFVAHNDRNGYTLATDGCDLGQPKEHPNEGR